ncbi:CRAL/TRIO domain-containing protein [Penicillium antarcticum]|uniref:CRAL/TRIO domain-containing protein n=1 Tax=Penicillium antarcticum TaxID=416450 RepID=UPI002397179B|nr:CRAL/TRIO domain-containing protein [Penicillium antarcticum]KAJ5295883.1 CRAL/TRIO domain-containing protein [Penicillium antarcticum]
MDQFKQLCHKNGYNEFQRKEYTDETTIRRFLRAQRNDVGAAFRQFHECQKWRRAHDVRGFYEGLDVTAYDETRKMNPQWTGRRDREGRPVYVYQVREITKKKLDDYFKMLDTAPRPSSHLKPDVPIHILHFHALYENLLQFTFPLASELPRPDPEHEITASTHIVDISNVSVVQFWNIRKYLQDASRIGTEYYPETLARVFVVGAPAFFRSVWDAASQWFAPDTRSRISILASSKLKSSLLSQIDASDLPKEYGGELDWQWGDPPNLDSSTKELVDELYHKSERNEVFSKGPIIYEDGCIRLLGSVDGSPRRNSFCHNQHSS